MIKRTLIVIAVVMAVIGCGQKQRPIIITVHDTVHIYINDTVKIRDVDEYVHATIWLHGWTAALEAANEAINNPANKSGSILMRHKIEATKEEGIYNFMLSTGAFKLH